MSQATCYNCRISPAGYEGNTYSAFCKDCQPADPQWWAEIKGKKQAQCNACHELFTTVRTFDSHQVLRDGKLTCKDPRRMFRRSDHRRMLVLTVRGWAKNPELDGFNTFAHAER